MSIEADPAAGRDVAIRRAGHEDIELIVRLDGAVRLDLAALAPAGFGAGFLEPGDAAEMCYEVQQALQEGGTTFLVAEQHGQALGYCRLWLEENSDDLLEAPFMTVEQLGVLPEARGRGIARALLIEAEMIARNLGVRAMELSLLEANEPARKLYESLGYIGLERRMGCRLD